MKKIKPKAPALIFRHLNQNQLEMRERMMYLAFQRGYADPHHYYTLVDIANILMMAGSSDQSRQYARDYVKTKIEPLIDSIRSRFTRTEKIGASGPELQIIRELIDFNVEFWKRQPGELFIVVINEYNKILEAR